MLEPVRIPAEEAGGGRPKVYKLKLETSFPQRDAFGTTTPKFPPPGGFKK